MSTAEVLVYSPLFVVGLAAFLAYGYCTPDLARTTWVVASWAVFHIVANVVGGVVLDRRFPRPDDVMVTIGRCLLVAVGLFLVSLFWLQLAPPSMGTCG